MFQNPSQPNFKLFHEHELTQPFPWVWGIIPCFDGTYPTLRHQSQFGWKLGCLNSLPAKFIFGFSIVENPSLPNLSLFGQCHFVEVNLPISIKLRNDNVWSRKISLIEDIYHVYHDFWAIKLITDLKSLCFKTLVLQISNCSLKSSLIGKSPLIHGT